MFLTLTEHNLLQDYIGNLAETARRQCEQSGNEFDFGLECVAILSQFKRRRYGLDPSVARDAVNFVDSEQNAARLRRGRLAA